MQCMFYMRRLFCGLVYVMKGKMVKNKDCLFCFETLIDVVFILFINVKMPAIVVE